MWSAKTPFEMIVSAKSIYMWKIQGKLGKQHLVVFEPLMITILVAIVSEFLQFRNDCELE